MKEQPQILYNKLAWVHQSFRVKVRVELAHGGETQWSFFRDKILLVIDADAVLVTDGTMFP